VVRTRDELAAGLGLFFVPEVPFDEQVLSFGVAVHALAVTPELGSWGGKKRNRASRGRRTPESALRRRRPFGTPNGAPRAEVDDLDVTDRVDDFGDLRGWNLAHVLL